MRNFNSQLKSLITGAMIASAGGFVYVTTNGGTAKATLTDADGAALSNPLALTNGAFDFNVANNVGALDLYIQSPTGHFLVVKNVKSSGDSSLFVDDSIAHTTMVIPFDIADTSDNTETDTGFDLPTNAAVLPSSFGVDVTVADATETMAIGILSTESGGDANGFTTGLSVASAASIIAGQAVTSGGSEEYLSSSTLGALLNDFTAGSDSATDVGTSNKKAHVCDGTAKSISYTLSSGTDTAAGFIKIPLQLPIASL